jgi:hypothetical protein
MLTYTFSKREKALIVVFAVFLLVLAWYQFVFVNVQDQVSALNADIATAQDTVTTDTAKVSELKTMRAAIEQYKAEGLSPRTMPSYDNTQNLMNLLNAQLSGTTEYSIKFGDLDTTSESGVVLRGADLSFGCNSYADAKTVLASLAQGAYPCSIDSLAITDNTASKSSSGTSVVGSGTSSSTTPSFSVTAHLTFYEKASGSTTSSTAGSNATTSAGVDLSALSGTTS